jgi:hypothetical protein
MSKTEGGQAKKPGAVSARAQLSIMMLYIRIALRLSTYVEL